MRNAIVVTLLVLPALAVARDAKMGKPEMPETAAKAVVGRAKGMAEKGKGMAEEARAGAKEKKADHAEHEHGDHAEHERGDHAEHEHGGHAGPEHGEAAPERGGYAGPERGEHAMRAHGRPAADVARGIVSARADVARARAESRRGEKERIKARMRGHAGHAMPVAALREEMRRHARRMARLSRVREVADSLRNPDADTIARADKLIDREQERHERWMGKHVGAGEAAAAPAAPAAAPQGGTP